VSGHQFFDKPAMLMGVVALIASGLYFLDLSGAVEVDEVVTAVSLWVGLGLVMVVRTGLRLRERVARD
jgi:multidrug transporter EmrE-like cation transporter